MYDERLNVRRQLYILRPRRRARRLLLLLKMMMNDDHHHHRYHFALRNGIAKLRCAIRNVVEFLSPMHTAVTRQ